MNKRSIRLALAAAAGLAFTGISERATATAPTVDGTLDASIYGSPIVTQTVNTSFGDSTIGDGTSSGGSELDAGYATVQNGNLYLFLAGNFENNGNRVNVFIADGRSGGQNTLNASSSSGYLHNSNGTVLPAGFNATFALDLNNSSNTFYVDEYGLTNNTANYIGSVPLTGGIGSNNNLNGIAIGVNDTNTAGVNGSTGSAADPVAADAVITGIEIAFPLAALGYPTGSISVLAAINNNGDSYYSNQFLPGLPVGYGNLGGSPNLTTNGYNYSSPAPFTVTIPPTPNGVWESAGGGSWNSSGNWANGVIPNAAGLAVVFATAQSNSTVSLDGAFTAGSITFNSTYSYALTAGTGGVLTLDNGSSQAVVTSYGGSQTISAPVVLNSNATFTAISHGDTITVSGNISGPHSVTTFSQGAGGTQFAPSLIILSGSNSYTGGTIVDGGNLQLGSANALPPNSALTLDAHDLPSGALDINGFSISLKSLNVTTGPNTQNLGAYGRIINTTATPGVSTITYAGNASSPDNFYGIISDSAATSGGTTAFVMNSGALTMGAANTYAGNTNIAGGTLTLGVPNALPGGTNLTVATGAKIIATPAANASTAGLVTFGTLSGGGTLDITNNGLLVSNSSIGAVTTLVGNGFHGGAWNGSGGISSSTAAADTTHLTAIGVIVNDNGSGTALYGNGSGGSLATTFDGNAVSDGQVIGKYTYYGDSNLDGAVDGSDYTLIDAGFNGHLTGWYNGDFNYDGTVDGSDYTLIDNAFNSQGASLGSNPLAVVASSTAQIAGGSAVPEPTSLGLLGCSTLVLLGKRRRSK